MLPIFTWPNVVYRNTGISATVMARAWIMDMPSVLRKAMAGPAHQARALGAKCFQGERLQLVAGWVPGTVHVPERQGCTYQRVPPQS